MAENDALRRQAETRARENAAQSPENLTALSPEEIGQTLHQLHVHQIELEMQNEELRRTQLELDAARARYFDLYDLAPVGYWTVSDKGLILEANLTAATLLGVARGALVQQPITRLIFKEDQDIYYRHRKQIFETGAPQACELRLVKNDGTPFWARLEATVAQNADGAPVCRVVLSDISERKQAETALRELNATLEQRVADRTRQLAEANAQLSEIDRLKDDFISRISHELRTPLTSIIIYLDLFENGKPEKRAKYLQVLNEQAVRLQHLIESLLEVTQHSGNAAGLRIAPTDLNHLAGSLAADMVPRAAARGLTLTTTLTSELPCASADAISLAQALSKLAANALNYTPAGGAIDLSTAEVIENGETWITCTIRDTGPGVAPNEQPHIFARFYRGRAAADYKIPGAGTGLAISRDLLTLMAGRLTVQSDGVPGRGAAFTAWLKPA
jgi:PAS domain S-box-containing protein